MTDLSIYSIDFEKMATRLTPWFWRGPVWVSLLKAMLAPLQSLNAIMVSIVTSTWTQLSYTGQHLALEEYLNDNYDNTLRRIFITENDLGFSIIDLYRTTEIDPSPLSLYRTGETDPSHTSMYRTAEGVGGSSFTVNIPAAVTYDEPTLRDQLAYYVLADKNYNIVTF